MILKNLAQFPLGVYVGNPNGSDTVAEAGFDALYSSFTSLMGVSARFMDAYVDQTKTIDQWLSNASWTAWSYASSPIGKTMTPVIGLPLSSIAAGSPSADQFYKNFAVGDYDGMIQGMVKAWAVQGFAIQYWRPSWEMNLSGPTYAGTDASTQADWIAAFRHVSIVLHAAARADGVTVKVIWNPGATNYSNGGTATQTLYPGNQYVDVIGADVYGELYPYGTPTALYDWDKSGQVLNSSKPVYDSSVQQWASDPVNLAHYYTYPASNQWSLNGSGGHSLSLQNLIDFAKAQGKPIAIAETGAGNTADGASMRDNPTFVQWLSSTLTNSGVAVDFVSIWDSNGGGTYEFSNAADGKPQEASAWAKYFGAQVAPAAVVVGSGPDMVVLRVSEDAYQGDAQFVVSIDGSQIGGTQTATASHFAGQDQTYDFAGSFGAGQHSVSVDFLNDAYGGSIATDRNLYVDGAAYNGTAAVPGTLVLLGNGTRSLTVGTPAAAPDKIDLRVAEDAWKGDAQFTVTMDGKSVGGVFTATASHAAGALQDIIIPGNWGSYLHDINVSFTNDAYGGSSIADRNLYVEEVTYDGRSGTGAPAALWSNSTDHFMVPAILSVTAA